jgi:recombination protein RecR
MNYASKLLEQAVDEISQLPGIGKKTAMRLALHLLKREADHVHRLGNSLIKFRDEIQYCKVCKNISDVEICEICNHPGRDHTTVCVVEDIRDVIAIEQTGTYKGVYHVLGGLISPMDGVGPSDLHLGSLFERIEDGEVKELIFAIGATMEGDTTAFYMYQKLSNKPVKLSSIARGIHIGDALEYADEITLSRSIAQRIPYEASIRPSHPE